MSDPTANDSNLTGRRVSPVAVAEPADEPAAERSASAHLSPTSAATFNQCPRRWQLRYVERRPDPPGLPALVGTLAHRVLELLLNEPPGERQPTRARQLAGEVWPEHAVHPDFVRLGLDPAATRAFKWQAWRAIEGLWQVEDPREVEVRATEQRVEVEVGGVPFVGVVDRLDLGPDGMIVTDYKSGRPPAPQRAGEKLDQVLLYAAAVAAATGERPVRARLLYLGAVVIEVDATADAVDRAVERLVTTWRAVEEAQAHDAFPARPGPLCGWCPYLADCPEGRDELRARARAGWYLPAHAPGLAALVGAQVA
jgi:putative RecB family exonuclease